MDELTINLESGVPIYMQLVDRIKQMVVSGQLLPDSSYRRYASWRST